MTMKTLKTGIFLAFLLISFTSCKSKIDDKESPHEILPPNTIELSQAQYNTVGIQLGSAEKRAIRKVLDVNGVVNVTPQDIASVSAPLGGFIKSTMLVQGSPVVKGQVLAQIENMAFIDLQQNYLETKAKYEYAAIEFKRHNELYKDNVYSENNMQQKETEYKTLNVQLKSLEQKLRLLGIDPAQLKEDKIVNVLPIVAPISGYLKSVHINVGKYVGPTDVLFEIVNPDNLMLELVIFEKDVEKVESGQKLTFSTPDHPEIRYAATLYQTGKVLDNDKTAMAYARIDQPDHHLLSGMYVNAKIETESNNVISVPQQSVVQFNEKFYIFVFKGKRIENGKEINDFEALEVTKGATEGGYSEILLPSGSVSDNLRVVVKGAYSILSAWKNAGEMAC